MKQETAKPKLRKVKSQAILTSYQHQIISSLLPKNYSLVAKKYFEDFANKNKRVETSSQSLKIEKAHSQSCKDIIKIKHDEVESLAAIEKQSQLAKQKGKTSLKEQHKEVNTQAKNIQQQVPQQKKMNPQILPMQNANIISLQKIVNEMVNHPSFTILYSARRQNSNIRKQLKHIDRMLKGKNYQIQSFKEDVKQLFIIYFSQCSSNSQISSFQEMIINQILKLQEFAKTKAAQQEPKQKVKQVQQLKMVRIEQAKTQQQKPRQKKQTRSHFPRQRQFVNNYEQGIPLPIKKGKNPIAQRPQNTKIKLKDIASLGYNMAKLSSRDLQSVCISFCNRQYMNSLKQVEYYNINLQKLTASQFLQLQAFVKNAVQAHKNIYQLLVDPYENDDFVLTDD